MKIQHDQKKYLILYGPSLVNDRELKIELEKDFVVLSCEIYEELIRILNNKLIDFLLFQVNSEEVQVTNLKQILSQNHKLLVIVLGNGKQRDMVAQVFELGAGDFFRLPYRRDLLVERVRFLAGGS